jgi:hypothetical protein
MMGVKTPPAVANAEKPSKAYLIKPRRERGSFTDSLIVFLRHWCSARSPPWEDRVRDEKTKAKIKRERIECMAPSIPHLDLFAKPRKRGMAVAGYPQGRGISPDFQGDSGKGLAVSKRGCREKLKSNRPRCETITGGDLFGDP